MSAGETMAGLDDPRVAAAVRLLHRRRGWAWTFAGSLIALVVYTILAVRFLYDTTGVVNDIAGVALLLLFALVVLALAVVIVDTVRLRGREPLVRAQARSLVSGRLVAVLMRRQPHHLLLRATLVLLILPAPASLPYQVDGFAYAVGAGRSVTFLPQSHEVVCSSRTGCSTVTDGILLTRPPVHAVWRYQVPLGKPFAVRQPVWDGLGSVDLMNGSQAAAAIVIGLLFDVLAVVIAGWFLRGLLRRLRASRRGREHASQPRQISELS